MSETKTKAAAPAPAVEPPAPVDTPAFRELVNAVALAERRAVRSAAKAQQDAAALAEAKAALKRHLAE